MRFYRKVTILMVAVFLFTSCDVLMQSERPTVFPNEKDTKLCGNGICEGPENPNNCPADCTASDDLNAQKNGEDQAKTTTEDHPLYIGIMVHLEGWQREIFEEEMFNQHVSLIREYADLFEKYDAKLTWETIDIAKASNKWGDNVLLEMENRGHGVGVHADVGGQKNYDCAMFSKELKQMKTALESLGVSVRHASGVVSHCDWVNAMVDSGYAFTTGMVAYGVMSLPIEMRPEEYRSCPSPLACHDTYPPKLEDRLHPWRMHSGSDWIAHDANGKLVMLPSSQGLACYQEESVDSICEQEFTEEDLRIFFQELESAIALRDPNKVNVYYVSWSLGKPIDVSLMEEWLQNIQPYVEDGLVEWKTLPEMYDVYIRWETNN